MDVLIAPSVFCEEELIALCYQHDDARFDARKKLRAAIRTVPRGKLFVVGERRTAGRTKIIRAAPCEHSLCTCGTGTFAFFVFGKIASDRDEFVIFVDCAVLKEGGCVCVRCFRKHIADGVQFAQNAPRFFVGQRVRIFTYEQVVAAENVVVHRQAYYIERTAFCKRRIDCSAMCGSAVSKGDYFLDSL